MNEIIMTYPNVSLSYSVPTKSGICFECFNEIKEGKFGYRLTEGQTLESIRYHGSNYDHFVQPKIQEIRENGLVITHLLQKQGEAPVFVPFVKELPAAGKYAPRDMYIEPCGHLYEKNKLEDVLTGNVETEEYLQNGKIDKNKGYGIWYQHCRFRTPVGRNDNLKNFVRMGQQSLLETSR